MTTRYRVECKSACLPNGSNPLLYVGFATRRWKGTHVWRKKYTEADRSPQDALKTHRRDQFIGTSLSQWASPWPRGINLSQSEWWRSMPL